MRRMNLILAAGLLLGLVTTAPAETVVREFSGLGTEQTSSFSVRAPWVVNWRTWHEIGPHDTSNIEIYLYDASTGRFHGRVTEYQGTGGGDVLIDDSGRFHFRIVSRSNRWQLRVIAIDDEEARRLRGR